MKQYFNYINWWYKSKYSSSPKDILIKKIFKEDFNLCEEERAASDEIIKSINSQISNISPGSDGLKAVFYKHFSNKLAPVLLDVYDPWGKLGIISVTSRTGIMSPKYKKGDKRDTENYRPTSFLNLYYKIFTTIFKGYLHYKTVCCHKVALDV